MIAEEDKVAVLTTMKATLQGDSPGLLSTGERAIQRGVSIFRFANASIVEMHSFTDQWGLPPQLGNGDPRLRGNGIEDRDFGMSIFTDRLLFATRYLLHAA